MKVSRSLLQERAVKLKLNDVESAESTESELQLCTSDETSADMLSPVQATRSMKVRFKLFIICL